MGLSILDDRSIVLAGGFKEGEMVKKVTKVDVSDLTNLFSSQEEADTHIMLHAVHLASTYKHIIIRSDDTDVLVLYACWALITMQRPEMVCDKVSTVGKDIYQNLPAAHALLGSDTIATFFQIGNRTTYSNLADLVREAKYFEDIWIIG